MNRNHLQDSVNSIQIKKRLIKDLRALSERLKKKLLSLKMKGHLTLQFPQSSFQASLC